MLALIDAGSRRGAWQGSELEVIASIRKAVVEKIKNFSDSVEENVDSLEDANQEE